MYFVRKKVHDVSYILVWNFQIQPRMNFFWLEWPNQHKKYKNPERKVIGCFYVMNLINVQLYFSYNLVRTQNLKAQNYIIYLFT